MNILNFLIYTVFITYVSLRPKSGVSIENWDKVGHMLAYFIFALVGYRVVSESKQYMFLCFGIVIYGGLIEVAQSYVPGRMMSAYDILANTLGVAIALIFTRMVFRAKNI